MADILHVKLGQIHPVNIGKRGKTPLLDVVVFLFSWPAPADEQYMHGEVANLQAGDEFARRLTIVSLQDHQKPSVDIIRHFQKGVLRKLSKLQKRRWLTGEGWLKKKTCHKFCFVLDEVTSYLVMGMMSHDHHSLYAETVGLVFLRHTKRTRLQDLQDGARRISDFPGLVQTAEQFDRVALNTGSVLGPVTWMVELNEPVYHVGFRAAIALIKVASELAVSEAKRPELRGSPVEMEKERGHSMDREGFPNIPYGTVTLRSDYCHKRESNMTGTTSPFGTAAGNYLPTSRTAGPDSLGTTIKATPMPRRDHSLETLDPIVHIQIGDIQPSLCAIDEYLRAGPRLDSLRAMKLRITRVALKVISGQTISACQELQQELVFLEDMKGIYQQKALDENLLLARYWLSEAFFRLGDYQQAEEQLQDYKVTNKALKIRLAEEKQNYLPELAPASSQLIHVFQLQALSVAARGDFRGANARLGKAQSLLCGLFRNRPERPFNMEPPYCQVAYISVSITKSKLIALRGDYQQSLGVILGTLNQSIILLGETHLCTLNAALFTSHLLVLTSRFHQARVLAEKSLKIMKENSEVEHPLVISALSVLTSVAQAEGRMLQGLSTATRMSTLLERGNDPKIACPLTVLSTLQTGCLHLRIGNFHSAESMLESAKRIATDKWKSRHPLTLRAQGQLALAQFHVGKLAKAKENILNALRIQLELFQEVPPSLLWTSDSEPKACLEKLIETKNIYYYERPMADPLFIDKGIVHPDALVSFLTLGKIESASQSSDGLQYASSLFDLVFRLGLQQLGESNEITMEAAFGLGTVEISNIPHAANLMQRIQHYKRANEFFKFVADQAFGDRRPQDQLPILKHKTSNLPCDEMCLAGSTTGVSASALCTNSLGRDGTNILITDYKPAMSERDRLKLQFEKNNEWFRGKIHYPAFSMDLSATSLGHEHPVVLRARRESILVGLFSEGKPAVDFQEIANARSSLVGVLRAQEHRLGWDHPDRLHTLIALLPVQLAGNESEQMLESTLDDLLGRLKKSDIRPQRLSETLLMREKTARLLLTRKGLFPDRVKEILTTIKFETETENIGKDDHLLMQSFKNLRARSVDLMETLESQRMAINQTTTSICEDQNPAKFHSIIIEQIVERCG